MIAVVFGGAMTIGVASKDSALGYLAVSALGNVLQQTLGFDVNFDESLGPQIERAFNDGLIPQPLGEERFDSLIEKVEPSMKQVHRPIIFSETANNAQVEWQIGPEVGELSGFLIEILTHTSITRSEERTGLTSVAMCQVIMSTLLRADCSSRAFREPFLSSWVGKFGPG